MKKLLLILCVAVSASMSAQQLFFELGRVSSRFEYESSEGKALENDFPESNLSAAVGYRLQLADRIYAVGSATYSRYETYGSYAVYDLAYNYRADYLGLNLGAEGEFFKKAGFTFFARLAAEPQFMLNGTRTINNDIEDLKGAEEFDSPFLFAKGGLGANYCADKNFAITLRYDYGMGFPLNQSEELLRYRTSTISLGILLNLKRCNYCLKSKSIK
ncbi:MAG: hypothetical protein WBG42_05490 [Cryomorphaceae bacterium]